MQHGKEGMPLTERPIVEDGAWRNQSAASWSWEAEQEEYRMRKRDSVDAAAICGLGMLIATVIAAVVWAWVRFFGPHS